MPKTFDAPVYWDAFIDEHRGVLKVAAEEGRYRGESFEEINHRVHEAIKMLVDTPERFIEFTGKERYNDLSQDEIWKIRGLLGFLGMDNMGGNLKYN